MSIHVAVGLVPVNRFDHEVVMVETFYWNRTYDYGNDHQRSIKHIYYLHA